MEDDDEFGDLYTDKLTTSFHSQNPPAPPQGKGPAPSRPIDLNINSDDEEILYGAPKDETLPLQSKLPESNLNFNQQAAKIEGLGEINESRVLEKSEDVRLPSRGFQSSNFMDDEADIDFVVEERDDDDKDIDNLGENAQNLQPMIPGVSIPGVSRNAGGDGNNQEEDWDSDSEDDLQIVLNDNTHGPMGMDGMGVVDDEDDEDGEPLVIVADNDGPSHHPPMMEEQEWGEEGGPPAANGERKEVANDPNSAKVGVYNNHGYNHPYHSQYKVSDVVVVDPGFYVIPM